MSTWIRLVDLKIENTKNKMTVPGDYTCDNCTCVIVSSRPLKKLQILLEFPICQRDRQSELNKTKTILRKLHNIKILLAIKK